MGIEVEGVMSRLNYLPLYKSVCVLSIAALLTACNATSPSNSLAHQAPLDNELLLKDELFPEASTLNIESQTEIFALSDEMKSLVATEIRPERKPHKKAKKLLTHIFDSNNVGLAYQSHANLTATETFNNQRANCMSLTIMAFALAEASGLDATFQDVQIPEYWVRNGEYNLLTGHVNLKIHNVKNPSVQTVWGSKNLEIDFDPFIRKKNFPKHKIDKNTVTAMFYNNKGAQSLVAKEWGVPVHDDNKLFEYLTLESAQAGLSWYTILKRREGYREAFANFDVKKVATFTEQDVEVLLTNEKIIRHRGKIEAAINNAKRFIEVQQEFGSFSNYQWGFVDHKTIVNRIEKLSDYPATSPISDKFSKDLKKRGFKFVGSTTIYAHMQA